MGLEPSLADVESIRLLLKGSSVIDWRRLAFVDLAQVDRFLRVNEFDPENPLDLERLEYLREDAVEYLSRNFGYRFPTEVAEDMPVRQLLLLASSKGPSQPHACIILKAMHVMHHLAGRELLFKLPVSDDELFGFVEAKVVKVVEEIRAAGYPIAEFAWSRKDRDSVVTKLLAKKASIAAHVYDKLRFRLVAKSKHDLGPILLELLHRLVPFNYVIPGESVNDILPFRRLLDDNAQMARHLDQLQDPIEAGDEGRAAVVNEFSGPSYSVINFVSDLPIKIDGLLASLDDPSYQELGAVVFVLTEFQVLDAETARDNELGDNSHAAYKARQHDRVRTRLQSGAALPIESTPSADDE